MKKRILTFILLSFFSIALSQAQSIRKNWREMTEVEKTDLINAFYQMRLGADLISDLADFHRNFFNFDEVGNPDDLDIHKNLPDEPEKEIFLAWHRRQMFEMEQAMQDLNPNISLPFVDWTIDHSIDSPVWDFNFMGQFDDDWGLGRDLGSGNLPTAEDVSNLLNFSSNFFLFSNQFERGIVHAGPHNWTGGFMNGPASPRDPIFYLHHTFVDKVWHDWEAIHGNSGFLRTSMLRYDGTYVFDGKLLPVVNPNDIVKSSSLGVFYANNELAVLEDYQVENTYRNLEKFYYQFTIEIGNNFTIPPNKNCEVESVSEIIFKPGFLAESGSRFYAGIDIQVPGKNILDKIKRNQIPFHTTARDFDKVYANTDATEAEFGIASVFPNPFENRITINNLSDEKSYQIEIYSIIGNMVYSNYFEENSSSVVVIENLDNLEPGIYILIVRSESDIELKTKLIKR